MTRTGRRPGREAAASLPVSAPTTSAERDALAASAAVVRPAAAAAQPRDLLEGHGPPCTRRSSVAAPPARRVRLLIHLPGVAARTNEAGRRENASAARATSTGARTRRDDKPPTTDTARMAWGTPEKIGGHGRSPGGRGTETDTTNATRARAGARVCASRERAENATRSPPTETVPDDTSELTKYDEEREDQDDVACERRVKSHAHIDARP